MPGNSLPAQLQKILESHVAQADIEYDDELRNIISRLSNLSESVEQVKQSILARRAAKLKEL